MDIGTALREARETRGLTLRDVSASTKISVQVLNAIERNDLAQLPGGLFVRGYLRAYAKEVGLDAEQVVGQYLNQQEAVAEENSLQQLRMRYAGSERHRGVWMQLAMLVALALLVYGLLPSRWPDAMVERVVANRAYSAVELESLKSPVAKVRRSTPELAAIELEIEPEGLCWVSAVSDGVRVIHQLMQPGERAVIEAREKIVLRVGDAGTFSYSINGIAGQPIGRHGEALTVEITVDNYHAFLSKVTDAPAL